MADNKLILDNLMPKDPSHDDNGDVALARPKSSSSASPILATEKEAGAKSVWEAARKPWAATPHGRLAIRLFSRGIMGAAFYSIGGHISTKGLANYDQNNPEGVIQHIAKFFDVAAGKPIAKIFGKDSTTFHHTTKDGNRTLGQEVVDGTFNFAMASTGDAIGRNIVGLFDPTAVSKWKGADGKFHFPTAIKSIALATANVFECQLEDWFVGVPYAYQKALQRKVINKFSPGFEQDADRGLNGASYKVDAQGNIKGTYGVEGAIDLQARFTGYNIGTLIFRDANKAAKKKLREVFNPEEGEKPHLHLPSSPVAAVKSGTENIRQAARYVLKSIIKGSIIMTPSVPVFWAIRTQQYKHTSIAIGPDGLPIQDNTGAEIRMGDPNQSTLIGHSANGTAIANPFAQQHFNPHEHGYGLFDKALRPIGKATYQLTGQASNIAATHAETVGISSKKADLHGKRYANAAIAYTPYIYAKNEFNSRWDNPQMDSAIYRTIDGVFGMKMGEVKSGLRDIRQVMFSKKKTLPSPSPNTPFAERTVLSGRPSPSAGWAERHNDKVVENSKNSR